MVEVLHVTLEKICFFQILLNMFFLEILTAEVLIPFSKFSYRFQFFFFFCTPADLLICLSLL